MPVGGEQKERQRENDEPGRDERPGDAELLRLGRIEAERRGLRLDEDEQHDGEAGEAAAIAQAPRPAGEPPEPAARHQCGQQRVVEHDPDLEAEIGDRDEGERP